MATLPFAESATAPAIKSPTATKLTTLKLESGDFVNGKIATLIDGLPETFTDLPECATGSTSKRSEMKALILGLYQGTLTKPENTASGLGYDLTSYKDTVSGKTFWLLTEKPTARNGQGIFAINASATKRLILEAPHPEADLNTGEVAAEIFRDSGAMALFIAGAPRCASSTLTDCDGTTTVCSDSGSSEGYRISDPAHYDCNYFQAAHEVMADLSDPDINFVKQKAVALQIHGFSKADDEPEAILSDGVDYVASSSSSVITLAKNLKAALDSKTHDGIASCQADAPDAEGDGILVGTTLCAETNVQGRYTNGSTDCCATEATTSANRFVHMELSLDLREKDTSDPVDIGPADLTAAINKTFSTIVRTPAPKTTIKR